MTTESAWDAWRQHHPAPRPAARQEEQRQAAGHPRPRHTLTPPEMQARLAELRQRYEELETG